MNPDPALNEHLRQLLAKLTSLTAEGKIHWNKQARSAHRYAEWKDILLILGPDTPLEGHISPRYLHITPLFSQRFTEISSEDPELRDSLLALIYAVEAATIHEPPTDPFALTEELMKLLSK